jgi:sec-independent protein translocase protein TatB
MFNLGWSEIGVIVVVAMVVIGPKDLPEAIRGVARGLAKLRRMAGEFQNQADELVREANLEEVRNSINEVRSFNVRNEIARTVDRDGTLRRTFNEDPAMTNRPVVHTPPPDITTEAGPQATPDVPAFIPPNSIVSPAVMTPASTTTPQPNRPPQPLHRPADPSCQ